MFARRDDNDMRNDDNAVHRRRCHVRRRLVSNLNRVEACALLVDLGQNCRHVVGAVFGLARVRDGSAKLLAISTAKPISSDIASGAIDFFVCDQP